MIELRTLIKTTLQNILDIVLASDMLLEYHLLLQGAKLYYQRAPDNAKFPYLVYDIPTLYDDGEGQQVLTLDVDGWDSRDDTTVLEAFMAEINSCLNKFTAAGDSIAVTFYLDRKLSIQDDDPRIRRRKYIYQGRLFERGV